MKRNLFVVVLLASLMLTACTVTVNNSNPTQAPAVPAVNESGNSENNININVNVDAGAQGSGSSAADAAQPAAQATAQATAVVDESPYAFEDPNAIACGAPIPQGIQEPRQARDSSDSICYPKIFKAHDADGNYYAGALAWNAKYPDGWTIIEEFEKNLNDGNYLHGQPAPDYKGFTMADYVGGDSPQNHLAPAGVEWTIILIEGDGSITLVEFPLK